MLLKFKMSLTFDLFISLIIRETESSLISPGIEIFDFLVGGSTLTSGFNSELRRIRFSLLVIFGDAVKPGLKLNVVKPDEESTNAEVDESRAPVPVLTFRNDFDGGSADDCVGVDSIELEALDEEL